MLAKLHGLLGLACLLLGGATSARPQTVREVRIGHGQAGFPATLSRSAPSVSGGAVRRLASES